MKKYLLLATGFAFTLNAMAQKDKIFTDEDYARAEKFMSYHTETYIDKGSLKPNWLALDRFWYQTTSVQGTEFILVNPSKK